MAIEKQRHKAPVTASKGSSLIIQLPSTSANSSTQIDENNNHNRISQNVIEEFEQNNLINHCRRIAGGNVPIATSLDTESAVERLVTNVSGANSLLATGGAVHAQNHYRNHLNNFHNHIQRQTTHHHHHISNSGHIQQHNHTHHSLVVNGQHEHLATTREHYFREHLEAESDSESVTPPPHYHEIPGVVPAYQGRSSGPPPAYDDVVNPHAMPPSYQSLFGQMREARKSSNGLVDLFRQLFLVLIGTIGCTMIIGFLLLIPVTMILVGVVYVNDCRAENIPLFLVIGGLVWIVKNVLNCYNQFKKDAATSNRPPPRRHPIATTTTTTTTNNSNNSAGGDLASVPIATTTATTTIDTNGQVTSSSSSSSSSSSTSSSSSSSASNFSAAGSSASVLIVDGNASAETSNDAQTMLSSSDTQHQMPTTTATTTTTTTTTATTTTTVTPSAITTRTRSNQADRNESNNQQRNYIRHPPMIGLTSYKCESILNYFLIVWFLAGCIVVYRIYEPDYDNPASANYCNRLVYLYAFWLMTSAFIVTAIILSCLCCLMASSLMSCGRRR